MQTAKLLNSPGFESGIYHTVIADRYEKYKVVVEAFAWLYAKQSAACWLLVSLHCSLNYQKMWGKYYPVSSIQ